MDPVERDVTERSLGRAARPRWVRFGIACFLIVAVFFVVWGSFGIWHSLVTLPRTYDHLRDHGAKATAHFVGCPSRGSCTLRLTLDGATRTWRYGQNRPQFSGLTSGDPVAMLIDPGHPATAYTVRDVSERTNAGFSGSTAFGFVLLLIGLVGGYGLMRLAMMVRRAYLPDGSLRHRPGSS